MRFISDWNTKRIFDRFIEIGIRYREDKRLTCKISNILMSSLIFSIIFLVALSIFTYQTDKILFILIMIIIVPPFLIILIRLILTPILVKLENDVFIFRYLMNEVIYKIDNIDDVKYNLSFSRRPHLIMSLKEVGVEKYKKIKIKIQSHVEILALICLVNYLKKHELNRLEQLTYNEFLELNPNVFKLRKINVLND